VFFGNIFELYAAMFLACFLTSWAIWRFAEPYVNNYLDYTFISITCGTQLVYFLLSPKLYQEHGWVLYRKAGGDKDTRALYRKYLVWLSFLKLDTAFGLFCVLLSGKGVYNTGWMAGLDYTMLILCIFLLASGWYVVKHEHVIFTRIWFFFFPLLPAYIIGFWVEQYTFNRDSPRSNYASQTLGILFTICGICSFITRIALITLTFIVYNNFGKGLITLESLKKKDITTLDEERDSLDGYDYHADPEEGNWTLKDVIANTYALDADSDIKSVQDLIINKID